MTATPTRPRGRIAAALAAAGVAIALSLVAAPAAHAGSSTCSPSAATGVCGQITNNGTVSFTIATHYVSGSEATGTKVTLSAGQSSTAYKTSDGKYRDWDAFYVPANGCAKVLGGPFGTSVTTVDRRSKVGLWSKVDNYGAKVGIKILACP